MYFPDDMSGNSSRCFVVGLNVDSIDLADGIVTVRRKDMSRSYPYHNVKSFVEAVPARPEPAHVRVPVVKKRRRANG
jgi:hypothetical protein